MDLDPKTYSYLCDWSGWIWFSKPLAQRTGIALEPSAIALDKLQVPHDAFPHTAPLAYISPGFFAEEADNVEMADNARP
jgi:hypothetical protein